MNHRVVARAARVSEVSVVVLLFAGFAFPQTTVLFVALVAGIAALVALTLAEFLTHQAGS